jgi:Ca-activated chloride channel homolog
VTDPRQLAIALRATADEWWRTRWEDIRFSDAADAAVVLGVLLAVAVLVLVVRVTWGRGPGRTHVAMPSVVPAMHRSHMSMLRHLPVLLFVLGVPCFAMALADPLTGFTREEVSYPGRRIALLVDASTSMVMSFKSTKFKTQGESTFFSAVAGAEYFIKRRMNGPYRDLVALIQFGNQAYVVTPFTNDYENILLSVRLVSDPREWGRFSDWGTTIVEGIDQATQLFKAFNFVNASGNLMIVFTDGRDSELNRAEKPLDNLVNEARTLKIPVHMIRTAYNYRLGEVQQDKIWKAVVERTGGRFYAAYDDDSLSAALAEIDRLSPGRIDVREYSVQRPRFAAYALAATLLWLLAAVLKLGFGVFRTFP